MHVNFPLECHFHRATKPGFRIHILKPSPGSSEPAIFVMYEPAPGLGDVSGRFLLDSGW